MEDRPNQTKIKKTGRQLFVEIPAYLANQLALKADDRVELQLNDDSLQIRPIGPPKFELPELSRPVSLRAAVLNRIGSWEKPRDV